MMILSLSSNVAQQVQFNKFMSKYVNLPYKQIPIFLKQTCWHFHTTDNRSTIWDVFNVTDVVWRPVTTTYAWFPSLLKDSITQRTQAFPFDENVAKKVGNARACGSQRRAGGIAVRCVGLRNPYVMMETTRQYDYYWVILPCPCACLSNIIIIIIITSSTTAADSLVIDMMIARFVWRKFVRLLQWKWLKTTQTNVITP